MIIFTFFAIRVLGKDSCDFAKRYISISKRSNRAVAH